MRRLLLIACFAILSSNAHADAKEEAFECLDNATIAYALASCEMAETVIKAARGFCATEIKGLTSTVVNDRRYTALTLEKRLEFADRLILARDNRLTNLILEARVRSGKMC